MIEIAVTIEKADIPVYAADINKKIGAVTFRNFVGTRGADGKYHGVYLFEASDESAARRAFAHLPGLGD